MTRAHRVYYAANADGQQLSPDVFTYERAMFYVAQLRGINHGAVYMVRTKQHDVPKTPSLLTGGNQ